MRSAVAIGGSEVLKLEGALLVYGSSGGGLVSWHEVRWPEGEPGAPYLGEAQPLSVEFVRGLARSLRTEPPLEILPPNVLVRSAESLVWWTPACHQILFFKETSAEVARLSGRRFPQPALVWKVAGKELWVRALGGNIRPSGETKLAVAPYWNVDGGSGLVCQGTMRSPQDRSAIGSIGEWQKAFYASAFTHQTGTRRLTSYRGGFCALWAALDGRRGRFPVKYLEPAGQTLLEFVRGQP